MSISMRSNVKEWETFLTLIRHFSKYPIASFTSLAIRNCSFDFIFLFFVKEAAAGDAGLLDLAVLLGRGGILKFFGNVLFIDEDLNDLFNIF